MRFSSFLDFLLPASQLAISSSDPLQPLTISAPGINATFIGYGATLTHLFVNDREGLPRDVAVGYDTPAEYVRDTETKHTYFGAVVGRYANRIKNGTFVIDGKKYQVPTNEHGGQNTLHGGTIGWDARGWTVSEYTPTSVTFSLHDADGYQGFPGAVLNHITYTVASDPPRLTSRIVSVSLDQPTPIMPTTHFYWNLGAFTSPTVLNDTLHLPYSDRIIGIDGIQIPTGEVISLKPTSGAPHPLDFTSPKQVHLGALTNGCGDGCVGIDNAFILDRPGVDQAGKDLPMLRWSSPDTGIQMTMRTNQGCTQVYSCVFQDGSIPTKSTQRAAGQETIDKYGCLVIEPQEWIDGINHPEWAQLHRQVFGPETGPLVNWAEYTFDTV
ncbi:hypothetical protein JCM24511_05207 [Saitozyma sp. JCM 24511]|nr:hypothetical protein JCM24511_05207 [Saitozyma sp. JCM 24511]